MLHFHRKLHSYMQFGGHIELHENPLQALQHELLEESGYHFAQVKILQPPTRLEKLTNSIVHPQPIVHGTYPIGTDHFHTDSAYALVAHEPPQDKPAEGESTQIQLFTRQELLDLPDNEIIENVREIALFIFDHRLNNWRAEALPSESELGQ